MGALPAAEVLADITFKEYYDQQFKLGVTFVQWIRNKTYHRICHRADPAIGKRWILRCCTHGQGVEKSPED